MSRTRTAAVILAAGLGERLGRGPKAFLRWQGQTFLARAARALRESGCPTIVAVLPEAAPDESVPAGITVVRNPRPQSGPLVSLLLGLSALGDPPELLVAHPVDHPLVGPAELGPILAAAREADAEIARVAPTCAGRPGHPIAILEPGLRALAALAPDGDDGRANPRTLDQVLTDAGPTLEIEVDSDAILRNINTTAALEALGRPDPPSR